MLDIVSDPRHRYFRSMSLGSLIRLRGAVFFCVLLVSIATATGAHAQGFLQDRVTLYATLGTADIYRGLQRADRDFAIQAGANIQLGRFSIGASIHDAQFSIPQDRTIDETELDFYLTYSREINDRISWQLQFKTYTFPGSSDAFFEYDYNEVALNFELPAGLSWSIGASDTSVSFANGIAHSELIWRRALSSGIEFSAGLGAVRELSSERDSYTYWDVGLSRLVHSVAVDLRYHYSPYESIWLGRSPAKGTWALNLTKGWSF